jgi:hypothetical protein
MHAAFAEAEVDACHVLVDPPDTPDAVADAIEAARVVGDLAYRVAG